MTVSVIIPFHRNIGHLAQSVAAARQSLPDAELIVVADAAFEDCDAVAAASRARVIRLAGPVGPAVARNRGALEAAGGILVFVDADVVAHDTALRVLRAEIEADPELAALFGAYDLNPSDPGFLSQYRNLAHAYTHETGSPAATTFWAGLGGVRANAFRAVGGFDETFTRPSVEDIALGYRLTAAGYRIRLDPRVRGTHLKRWTLGNAIATDIVARGIPWVRLILQFGALRRDLNTTMALRASVVFTWAGALAVAAMPFRPAIGWIALPSVAALVAINAPFYRWCHDRRGVWFAIRAFAAHTLQHLCNGISLAAGIALHLAGRRA